ncbi:MAG: protein translocase subunit SecF [Bdellovibrionaceae bacterium]|nr:protein translocase subunit SecF [Pseudobdellovibrionaceae bacterium]
MFHIIRPGTNFDFVGKRKVWLGLSTLAVIASIVLLFTKGLNFGIDFTGGAEVHVKVPTEWSTGVLRKTLEDAGIKNAKVVTVGEQVGEFLVRVQGDAASLNAVSQKVEGALKTKAGDGNYSLLRVDVVGPAAGSTLKRNGLLAMFYALFVILIYVAVRFDSRYAPGAVLALFHDAMIVLGIFVLTGKQFDLTILAAVLALIGYSNNDTVVVFDRVRETTQMHPQLSISQAVNRAINETLGRTILTSLTTFFVVASLFFFGGTVIENFAFTLMCGVVIGTYSSVFIASSLIIVITEYRKGREDAVKRSGKKKKKRRYEVRSNPGM